MLTHRETVQLAKGVEQTLTIGYLKNYQRDELQQTIPCYRAKQPDVVLHILSGTHEELYKHLRTGKADLVINDLRRTPSERYVNCFLVNGNFYVELAVKNPLLQLDTLSMEDLKNTPCILSSTKEESETEETC